MYVFLHQTTTIDSQQRKPLLFLRTYTYFSSLEKTPINVTLVLKFHDLIFKVMKIDTSLNEEGNHLILETIIVHFLQRSHRSSVLTGKHNNMQIYTF